MRISAFRGRPENLALWSGLAYALERVMSLVKPDLFTLTILAIFGSSLIIAFAQTLTSLEPPAHAVGTVIGWLITLYLVVLYHRATLTFLYIAAYYTKVAALVAYRKAVWAGKNFRPVDQLFSNHLTLFKLSFAIPPSRFPFKSPTDLFAARHGAYKLHPITQCLLFFS